MSEEQNKLIQQWMRDFDKQAKDIGGMMFIKVPTDNGEILTLNIDEYLQYKLNSVQ